MEPTIEHDDREDGCEDYYQLAYIGSHGDNLHVSFYQRFDDVLEALISCLVYMHTDAGMMLTLEHAYHGETDVLVCL